MNPKTAIKRLLLRHGGWEAKAWIQSRRGRNDLVFAEARNLIRDIEPGSVLILAPHPDDEAIGVGGTLLLHRLAGAEVTVLYLTDGSAGKEIPGLVEARRGEAKAVGDRYGIKQVFWDEPDTQLNSSQKLAGRLTEMLQDIKPRHLYLPSFFEKHTDHFMANQLAVDAMSRYNGSEISLCGYEVWDNIVKPNYHIDITEHFSKKIEMLALYRTPMEETNYIRLCEARSALHHFLQCFGCSEGHAEAFFRADPVTYKAHYDAYVEVLRETGSSLVKRLAPN
jgi:LmbE family N-acetylglucosaminyl deacetylase